MGGGSGRREEFDGLGEILISRVCMCVCVFSFDSDPPFWLFLFPTKNAFAWD